MRQSSMLVVALTLATACGDHRDVITSLPDATPPAEILTELNALPGVTATELTTGRTGYRYFILEVTQPIDHDDPNSATFQQEISLLHRDVTVPMVAFTTGYDDYWHDYNWEPTDLLDANQMSIEHRFFGTSRPSPADWTKLTIAQEAADQHHIHELLSTIYTAPWLATGPSKGGMTTVYYRRFYPDDVAGSLPYVAPLSFGTDDLRYASFLDTLGPDACRQAVRDAAVDMLTNRRAMLLSQATDDASTNGYQYTRVAIGPAVESAVASLEWSYWQYTGVDACSDVPTATSTDAAVWKFLEQTSPVEDSDDDGTAEFEAYDYQAEAQLGQPDGGGAYLTSLLQYTAADYAGSMPIGVAAPTFDPTAMMDIDAWVQASASRMLFIYGQWDPWSGGMFTLGNATDSALYVNAEGTHGSEFHDLASADSEVAYGMIERWAGVSMRVAPGPASTTIVARPPVHRVPPAVRMRGRLLAAARRGV